MKINVGEYDIVGKENNWIIYKIDICTDKDSKNYGKEYYADQWYFGKLYQVLYFLLNCQIGDGQKSSIKQLIAEINTIGKHIKAVADKVEFEMIREKQKKGK